MNQKINLNVIVTSAELTTLAFTEKLIAADGTRTHDHLLWSPSLYPLRHATGSEAGQFWQGIYTTEWMAPYDMM